MTLVNLEVAKAHLRITGTGEDWDIEIKAAQATAIITDYLGARADATWTAETVPGHVQAGILLMLAHLYEHRGDDMPDVDEALWKAIERLLMRARDPALA